MTAKPAAQKGMRAFSTGATRNADASRPDYEGFLSPLALEAFGVYMHFHRNLPDGSLRESDNWQKGIPQDAYLKSLWRHFFDVWKFFRGGKIKEGIVFALCACLFNIQGLLHEYLKAHPEALEAALRDNTRERGR
jgi:hypothetical protein